MKEINKYLLGPGCCLILAIFKMEGWAVLSWYMVFLPIWLPAALLLLALLIIKK